VEDSGLKLVCKGCGASLEYSAGARALKCVYCSAVTEIPAEEDEALADTPEIVVPMAVTKAQLEDAVYQHLAAGKYTPDNLLEHATFSKVEQFYVPAYVFSGGFDAEWTASFGYDRTEHYTVYERDSQGHSRPVTKTKTVTDWRPVNGTDSGRFTVLTYAGSRLQQSSLPLTDNLVELCHGRSGATGLPPTMLANRSPDLQKSVELTGKLAASRSEPCQVLVSVPPSERTTVVSWLNNGMAQSAKAGQPTPEVRVVASKPGDIPFLRVQPQNQQQFADVQRSPGAV